MDAQAEHAGPEFLPAIREFLESDAVEAAERAFLTAPGAAQPRLDALRDAVRRRGWWAPQLPVTWGGLGLPLPLFAEVSELLGRTPIGHYLFNCQAPDSGNM